MGALLGHPAVLQDQDAVGLHEGGDTVGDEDHGAALLVLPEGGADLRVGLGVHCGEGVVKDHDGRALHQHPGDGHALLLTAGEGDPPLPHHGVVPQGELRHGGVHAGGGCGGADLLQARHGPCGLDVLLDGA